MTPLVIQFIDSIKRKRFLVLLYWTIRISMGFTFIISGLRKSLGIKFTTSSIGNTIGFYFAAMLAIGFYWNFIDYFQIIIGLVAFFNRFIVITTLLMMPVTTNVFLISATLKMIGTPIIIALMLLGNTFLLFWHHKTMFLFWEKPFRHKQIR